MLAAAIEKKELNRATLWDDMKQLWEDYRRELDAARDRFDFLVPVELLVPSDAHNERSVQQFEMSVVDICAARNN